MAAGADATQAAGPPPRVLGMTDAKQGISKGGLGMPTADRPRCVGVIRPLTVTSSGDGRNHLLGDHLIDDGDSATPRAAERGQHRALCGRLITAAPLVAPPGPTCLDCETALHRSMTAQITVR